MIGRELESQLTLTLMTPLPPCTLALWQPFHIAMLPLGVCPGYPFFCIIRCLLVVDMTRDKLSERRRSPPISRRASHTLVSNASYSSLLMPPINLRMSSFDRERGKDRGRQKRKRGGGERGHQRDLFILQG